MGSLCIFLKIIFIPTPHLIHSTNHPAVKGHVHIPKDYPDIALVQWLSKQKDEMYMHCTKHPRSELPLHLKLLASLGVKAKKRHVDPSFSTRILRRKGPNKSKSKKVEK